MIVGIKSLRGDVLYAVDVDSSVPSSQRLRAALEKAAKYCVDLRDANLGGANLGGTIGF
jgi:uncharacterized protein YjbI with pentapeptide repeats